VIPEEKDLDVSGNDGDLNDLDEELYVLYSYKAG